MKKFFSLFAAVLFASSMMAGSVTFSGADFTGGTANTGSDFSVTKNGVTVSSDKAYGTGSELRIYAGGKLNVSAGDVNITNIHAEFTQYTKGTFDDATPNATSWSADATKQFRISELTVTIDGESGTSEGGGQGGGGEEGDEVTISGLVYADAYFYNYNGTDYWDFDLYKDYNESTQKTVYPEVYIIVEAESATTIAGTYYMDYAGYWKSANDSVEIDENDYEAILTITFDGSEYTFSGQFVGDDGKTYKFECTSEVYAYDVDNDYEEITLEDEETQGIEDIVLTEKAQKVVVDGAVYVIRDNKMYNVTGTRVR